MKTKTTASRREGGFILGRQLKIQSIIVRKAGVKGHEAAEHIETQSEAEMNAGAQPTPPSIN